MTVRALQLGPGIQVTPVAPVSADTAAAGSDQTTEPEATEPEMIALDDARRAAIVAFIEASETMKPEKRSEWLAELAQPEVSRATVEKFEAKIAEGQ